MWSMVMLAMLVCAIAAVPRAISLQQTPETGIDLRHAAGSVRVGGTLLFDCYYSYGDSWVMFEGAVPRKDTPPSNPTLLPACTAAAG